MGRRTAKGRKIPLSALDKFIYVFVAILGVALAIGAWVVFAMVIPSALAYSDPNVLGYSINNELILTSLLFSFLFFIPLAAFPSHWYSQKQPLFGNKNFKPRYKAPVIPTYPLFSKKYFESLDARYKKNIKILMIIWALATLLSLCLLLPTLCGRTVIYKNNTVSEFNSQNELSHNCTLASAESVRFSVGRSTSKGGVSYSLSFTLEYGDHEHSFSIYQLRADTLGEKLEYMLYLKELFGKDYEIRGLEYIDGFIREDRLNSVEIKLLYELLDYSE